MRCQLKTKITLGKNTILVNDSPETKPSETQIHFEEKMFLQESPLLLYVEDDKISQRVVEIYLRGIIKLEFANNGQEAIALANKKLYKGFLMDIHLCGMDGVQVTKELKKFPQYAAAPVIAVTAFAMKGDKEKFIEVGFTDYISKPFSKDELVTLIKKHFRK